MKTTDKLWTLVSVFASLGVMALAMTNCATDEDAPFTIEVAPTAVTDSMPGQRVFFLVRLIEDGDPVTLSAFAQYGTFAIADPDLSFGEVAEIVYTPGDEITDSSVDIPLTITATRGSVEQSATLTVNVWEPVEDRREDAELVRDTFIDWLAANRPELGITPATEWESVPVKPHILVVSWHSFYSEDWEMLVRWHVTIAPHDWADIHLRRRGEEFTPSLAFKIDSFKTEGSEPHAVDPDPEAATR